jgi:hypothetical protein
MLMPAKSMLAPSHRQSSRRVTAQAGGGKIGIELEML